MERKTIYFVLVAFNNSLLASSLSNYLFMAIDRSSLFPVIESNHYTDVIMGAMASQITNLTIVYSIVYSDIDQRKHQSSASLAFVNSPHKLPVTRKMFPFDDVIMHTKNAAKCGVISV